MSVFQLRNWWRFRVQESATKPSARTATVEEFDYGCMAVGNVTNSTPASDKIVVGSLSGTLRVFSPWASGGPGANSDSPDEHSVDDILLEENIGAPILQVLVGQFIPMSDGLGIAVLHPQKLSIYEVAPIEGIRGSDMYRLTRKYEHPLGIDGKHFSAYNMISGNFGGTKGREMILVQSLDGKLQIFEQSAMAFSRQMTDCLMPGPVWYMSKIDGFVTSNYNNFIECYKYQVLSSSQADSGERKTNDTTGMFNLPAIRGAMVEWKLNLGESCRQMADGRFSGVSGVKGPITNNELLVLCDQSLFLVKESGGIIQQRRLDFEPSCMCVFRPNNNSGSNFMIAGRDEVVRIYSEFNLVWAAKVDFVPVQMAVGNFDGKKGMIVMVGEQGQLTVGFLGTKPPVQTIANTIGGKRDMDYDKMEEENRRLLQLIRESQSTARVEPSDKLSIRTQLTRVLDRAKLNGIDSIDDLKFPEDLAVFKRIDDVVSSHDNDTRNMVKMSVRCFLSYNGETSLDNVQVTVAAPSYIHVIPNTITLQRAFGARSTPVEAKFYFFCRSDQLPHNTEITIQASYSSPSGEPRLSSTNLFVPIYMWCQPRPAQKSAAYKVIFETLNQNTIRLTELFDDLLFAVNDANLIDVRELGAQAEAALGIAFYGTDHINISAARDYISRKEDLTACIANTVSTVHNSPIVSVLVSKKAPRYQIQSDSLPALCMIAAELEARLNQRLNNGADESIPSCVSLKGDVTDDLPLSDFFAAIDVHHSIRLELNKHMSQLNDRAHQFRMVEKRLLVRFKDKNPSSLGFLGNLVQETYTDIIEDGDAVEELQLKQKLALSDVVCIAKYCVQLISIKCQLTSQERLILQNCFCPELTDGLEVGWEESVDAALTYLLRTSLAKTAKETATMGNVTLEIQASTQELKKHISYVFDRLTKGARLISDSTSSAESSNSSKK